MEMEELLYLEEKVSVELKSAKTKIPLSFYETYSAFANTAGGTIYLGISENPKSPHSLEGVENAKAKRKQLFDTLNDKSKVSAALAVSLFLQGVLEDNNRATKGRGYRLKSL